MGSGASKSKSDPKSSADKPTSDGSKPRASTGAVVKRGSTRSTMENGKGAGAKGEIGPDSQRSSRKSGVGSRSGSMRGSLSSHDMSDERRTSTSTIRAMRGSQGKRASFTDDGVDGELSKISLKSSDKSTGRHSVGGPGRTSVISVQRPGAPAGVATRSHHQADRHSAIGNVAAIKVSRSMDVKTLSSASKEPHNAPRQHSLVTSADKVGGQRKSRKEPSRHSLQMIHQSRQSVISLQDPNAPDVKRRMQLEEQIKRERLNKKMKSIVTVQLLKKMLDEDVGVKFREAIPTKVLAQVPDDKKAQLETALKAAGGGGATDDLQALLTKVNSSRVESFLANANAPKVINLAEEKADISKASAMLNEGRVAFQIFGAGYGDDVLSGSDVPLCNHKGMMESEPWSLCRALGSVDAQRYLIESKTSTSSATLLGRHLLQLSMVLTNIGNQARVNAVILIHCRNEYLDKITNDLLAHSHYGFLRENVVIIPSPAMPSYTWDGAQANGTKLAVQTGLSKSYYGNGYGIMQLAWPGQGMLVINNEQRRSRLGPSLLSYLDDHGIQLITSSNIDDLDKLMIPGALSMKLLSLVNQAISENVDKPGVGNLFLEVTKSVTGSSNKEGDLVIEADGAVRVISSARLTKDARERLSKTGDGVPFSCRRWYCSLSTLETKIIPALAKVDPRLKVGMGTEGAGIGVDFNVEDLTLDEVPSSAGAVGETGEVERAENASPPPISTPSSATANAASSAFKGNGLVVSLIEFAQPGVSFRDESDVDNVVAVLKEQDENQDFINMGVKCNFGKMQAAGLATSLYVRPRIMAMLSINDHAAIRPLRFLEGVICKAMDKITLAYVLDGEREMVRESLARASFEQFKVWSPEVNIQSLMIVKKEGESVDKTLCRYAEHEGVDVLACGSKALSAENVDDCSVVEILAETKKSVLVAKSGVRSKNVMENGAGMSANPTRQQQPSGMSATILVDEHFDACLHFASNFLNNNKDTLSLLRLTRRSDLPDATLEHFRTVQRCERLCCSSQSSSSGDSGRGAGILSVVSKVTTTMKDATGDGSNEVAEYVLNNEIGLLVIALPYSSTVSAFAKQVLVKVSCPVLFIRPGE